MAEFRGPAIDPEAFRVEGHCCGIRIPAIKELNGEGVRFEVSPALKAELAAAGIEVAEERHEPREKVQR